MYRIRVCSLAYTIITGVLLSCTDQVDPIGPVQLSGSETSTMLGGSYGLGGEIAAGNQAGNQAGSQAGSQAGNQAGNQAGSQAGNQAGTSSDLEVPSCDLNAAFEQASCLGCHGNGSIQGRLDLRAEDIEFRLLNAASHTSGCEGRKIINGRDWTKSVLLQAVNSEAALRVDGDPCNVVMPLNPASYEPITDAHRVCVTDWIEYIASLDMSEPIDPNDSLNTPSGALRKLKTLILGGAVSEAEIARAETEGLEALVTDWAQGPVFEKRLLEFFTIALQQRFEFNSQNQFGLIRTHNSHRGKLEQAMQEVIPRTALELVKNGEPFSQIASTRSFMMNTASMVAMLYPDQSEDQRETEHFLSGDSDEVPSSLNQQIARKRWYIEGMPGSCDLPQREVLEMLLGFINRNRCREFSRPRRFGETPLIDNDYNDWRMVRVNTNGNLEDNEVTEFYELSELRGATEVTSRLPRVGFFTSTAFLNQWPTNVDNQFRVTVNQALLTGLHIGFSGADTTEPYQSEGLDAEHSPENTECYGCHRYLDPMRLYFGNAFSADYRLPSSERNQEAIFTDIYDRLPRASFAFHGFRGEGGRVGRFGNNIANHERWASSWVQKVCQWANSSPCDETDPVFVTLRNEFSADGRFLPMFIAVMSSPLVTGLEPVESRVSAPLVSITRRKQLCGLLAERTLIPNICEDSLVQRSLGLIPVDGYARGGVGFTQPTRVSSFYFAAAEAICEAVATVVVTRESEEFSFTRESDSLEKLVSQIMSVPSSDSRYATLLQALTQHFNTLRSDGTNARDALRSAFTIACLSPDVTGLGL